MTLSVYRLNCSSYHAPGFKQLEKSTLESLPGIKVQNTQSDQTNVLITNTHSKLNNLPKSLKLILHPNSGHDNFSPEFVRELSDKNIPIILGNPIRAQAVTHYTLSCIFGRYTSNPFTPTWDPQRQFNRSSLWEKKVLLIGYGHVGKLIYKSLNPLVKDIQIVDPYLGYPALDHFLPLSDFSIVILAASLNRENIGIINKTVLETLPNDFTLINPARGKLVNQNDLFSVLKNKKAAFAYLDVFEKEPFKFSPLKNLRTSSHIAGVFKNLDHSMIKFELEVLSDYLSSRFEDLYLSKRLKEDYLI